MPRRRSAKLSINHERWLVSYADFITLLFAFFVVMYSISQVNEGKYRVLSSTLMAAFNPAAKPVNVVTSPAETAELPTDIPPLPTPAAKTQADRGNLGALEQAFRNQFGDLLDNHIMRISGNKDWLQIELNDKILFPSASAEVSDRAKEIFTKVADILADGDNPVQIEGFTDNIPISTPRYPSNWELSTSRASAIVKWMIKKQIKPSRLAAVGYGQYQPAASNVTAAGRAQNRRVAIMIARAKNLRPLLPEKTPQSSSERSAQARHKNQTTGSPTSADNPVPATAKKPKTDHAVKGVELDNGGLLFSSDPDLPRKQ